MATLVASQIRAFEEPAFWSGPGRLRDHLGALYVAVTQDALALAQGTEPTTLATLAPKRPR